MNKLGSLATVFGIGLVALNSAIYTVDPGEKALIMDKLKGLKQNVYGQGYHLLIPGIQVLISSNNQTPIIYDCRLKPIDIHVVTGTKDLQTVTISLRILQQPLTEHLPTIHQLLGRDYEKKIFNSIGQ
jgi:prohibitin 1